MSLIQVFLRKIMQKPALKETMAKTLDNHANVYEK